MAKQRGVVAAGHRLSAEAAQGVLREGGNAFDAALAGLACACVVEPVLASLAGGGFLLALPASGAARAYDFFVQTPRVRTPEDELEFYPIHADFGTTRQEFHIGRGSVAVPGLVRGLFEAHHDLCSMPMREILRPAVEAAKTGFSIDAFQSKVFRIVHPIYVATAGARAIYGSARNSGQMIGEGEVLRQPELADTLDALSREGDDLFYRGEIGAAIERTMRDCGHVTLDDLRHYAVVKRMPLRGSYRGAGLLATPPPSSGGLLIAFALALLNELDFSASRFGSAEHLQAVARAMALTSEARADEQARELAERHPEHILGDAYLRIYRDRILGRPASRRGTTHISVADAAGNVASMTVSNGEGSGFVVPGTGIMLNNMLGEEDLNPGGFHCWPTDQRMTSMMAPSILFLQDERRIALGSGGSNRIRSAMLQVLVNLLDFAMDMDSAVSAPRIHLEGALMSVEAGFPREGVESLLVDYPDHQLWEEQSMFFGGVHAVSFDGRHFDGAGDLRRDGVCLIA